MALSKGIAVADMDLGDGAAPAPAPLADIRASEAAAYEAAQASKPAPILIDNPLTRAFSGIIAGRRLQQASGGVASPAPAPARPLTFLFQSIVLFAASIV